MAVERPGRTALGDLRSHCSQQNRHVVILYSDLGDKSAGRSRLMTSQQCLKENGIELYAIASNFDSEMEKRVSSKPLGNTETFPARAT